MRPSKTKLIIGVIACIVGLPAVAAGIALDAWTAEGPAMEPTLLNGDRFVSTPFAKPEIGDIVVIESPADGVAMIKRIVALGGDTIEIREDVIYRNGGAVERSEPRPASGEAGTSCWSERVGDQMWTVMRNDDSPPSDTPPIVIPPGHVYVLGDHRDRSNDSRFFGPVPTDDVRGVLVARYLRGEGRTCP